MAARNQALRLGAATALSILAVPAAAAGVRSTASVSNQLLADTARRTPVAAVDYAEDRCDGRTVEQWLSALTGGEARSIRWTGGPCQIVGPGIDSGSRWCAQATVTLAHPSERGDEPMVEVFFEAPSGGKPGQAYAFRGAMRTADGWDTMRFRKDFESAWASRFAVPAGAVVDCPQPED